MPLPTPTPVYVNFNVEIDAAGEVILFGEAAPTVANVIVAEQTLPVTALYEADASGADVAGLIEIYEPENAQGNVRCQLANNDTSAAGGPDLTAAYQVAAKRLAEGLERLLCDEFDCSGVAPYSNYTSNVEYYKQRDFGRVMLGVYAHYLFGHVDATAAITNDKAFVHAMLSCSAGGDAESLNDASGAEVRYNSWLGHTDISGKDVEDWTFGSSNADAKLAVRLVEAIVAKGKAGGLVAGAIETSDISGAAATAGTIAEIVRQVLGQDSSRANLVDGSERTRDQHLLLRFYAGDVIYMNIKVKQPTVTVSGTGANPPAANLVTEVTNGYTLKITLA
jgi:hypothetical protein